MAGVAALAEFASTAAFRAREIIDGLAVDQLRARDGKGCLQFVRTLRPALMGKVKSAVACVLCDDGHWRPHAASHTVAVKQVSSMIFLF